MARSAATASSVSLDSPYYICAVSVCEGTSSEDLPKSKPCSIVCRLDWYRTDKASDSLS